MVRALRPRQCERETHQASAREKRPNSSARTWLSALLVPLFLNPHCPSPRPRLSRLARRAKSGTSFRPVTRVIFHLDMDAFYAAIEQRDDPSLRGQPVIVGSPPNQRGVVCAASYEARKFKVRSAMPSRTAAKLCPQGIFVRPRMDAYRAESAAIMEILRTFTPVIEKVSVDEAYLD